MHGSSWSFSVEASFHLCYKEIRVSRKMTLLPSETLSQTLDPKKFATASRRVLSTKLVNDRSCWPHLRQSTRRGRTHYTSVDRNAVTPLLRFAVRMLCNLFVQLCSRWQHFEWHSASRGPSVVAEILVIFYRRCLQSEPHGTGWLQQCAAARDTCVVYLSVASVSLMIAVTALSRSWITCSQARRRSISINSMCQWINV